MLITRYHTDVHDGGDRAFELVKDPGPRAIDPPLLIPSSLCFFLLSLELAHCAFTELLNKISKGKAHRRRSVGSSMDADNKSSKEALLVSSPDREKQQPACGCYPRMAVQDVCVALRTRGATYVLMDAAADEARALTHGQLWCCVLQAAAAVLALTSRRIRALAFAFAALAVTTANHCILVREQWLILLAAYPGINLPVIATILLILLILGVDLLGFRRLVRGWEEEQ
ncbi:hypothetical protein EJB05_46697, partial [Eragrostis curvula]